MTAAQLVELKARIKSEMQRRKYSGSLERYGDDTYDFTTVPDAGDIITAEQGQKTINLLLKINDIGDLRGWFL